VDLMFQIIAASGLGMGVLGAWLIWRARQVVAPTPACCGEAEAAPAPAPPRTIAAMLALALDYLRTRREWRYQRQWVMLIGEAGAGKSSLMASVAGRYRHPAQGKERQLAMRGCEWQLLDGGCLIDAPGNWMHAAANGDGGKLAREWSRVLDELNALRPERALDGLLLVVSARTLQATDLTQRAALASAIRQQLRILQERFAFSMPVYVLVSNADAVSGFGAFWRSQPVRRRAEIFGWSAPTQAGNGAPAAWADAAFDSVGQQLRALQMHAAANCERIAPDDADATFLFARHLQQLRVPLAHWLGIVFQPEPWQAGYFCRGIYFTGAVGASGDAPAPQDAARADLAFVDGLLIDKVLAEPRLARPTRQSIWSRDRLIRALQIGAIALLLALVFAQCIAAIGIKRKVDAVIASLGQMRQLQQPLAASAGGGCIGQEPVFQVLAQVAAIDTDLRHWAIPLSLVDRRLAVDSARRLADGPFKNVVMPALACGLRQRADAARATIATDGATYPESQAALLDYIGQIERFEQNLMRYNRLGGSAPFPAGELSLAEFASLAEYAFGAPLPVRVSAHPGVLPAVLEQVRDVAALASTPKFKSDASEYIVHQAAGVHAQLGKEINSGGELVGKLLRYDEPVLANTRQFTRWLTWVRSAWLGSSLENNPIAHTRDDLTARLGTLSRLYGYPQATLNAASALVHVATEYPAAMAMLRGLQLPSYGTLFVGENDLLTLNPRLVSELAGLNALMALDFMQVGRTDPFVCNPAISGWSASQIGMAATYAQEYDRFADKQGLPALTGDTGAARAARPLYDRLARHQLELVLNDNVQLAQLMQPAAGAGRQVSPDYAMPADLVQDQRSADFAKLVQPIIGLRRVYADKGMSSLGKFSQCVRAFTTRNLAQIQLLAEQSQLYQPAAHSASGAGRAAPFFDLGSAPEIKDYLARQSERAQVLARYATPFVNYLVNSGSAVPLANTDSQEYWVKTIDELNRYAQKDPNSQVARLDTLFSKTLPDLNGSNCTQSLAAYNSGATGHDLFCSRRRELEKQVDLRCKGARSAQAYDVYKPWAVRFNHELAGRYPFAALSEDDSSAATVRRFFADYAAGRADLRQKLAGLDDKYWDDARAFLNQLDTVAAFFDGILVPAAADPAAPSADPAAPLASGAIKLSVTFRAQPDDSPVSNQIVTWRLTSGGVTSTLPNRIANLDWRYGQPMSVGFDWAGASQLRPLKDDSQPDLRVEGRLATFSLRGDWALLRMIEQHRAANAVAGVDGKRSLLEFKVPVVSDDTRYSLTRTSASLFVGLSMNADKRPAALKIPGVFPRIAPQ
jgi:type VI secretion system protein ImpL